MNGMKLAFLLVLAGLTALFVTVRDIHTLDLFGNLAQWAALLFGAISLTRGANTFAHGSVLQKAWIRIAIGVWIWLAGQTMIGYSELVLHQIGYGTVADAFWLLGYVIMLSGLVLLMQELRRENNKNYRIHVLVLIGAFFIVFFPFLWRLIANPERAPAWRVLDLAYPALSYALAGISFILYLMSRASGKSGLSEASLLLCVSFALTAGTDLLFALHTDFNSYMYRLVDIFYFAAYFLFVFAGNRLVSQSET